MSGQRLPAVPGPEGPTGWAGFTIDPRSPDAAELRAGNADREYAARLLRQAYSEGRLTQDEYTARLASAQGARDLGQFVPLVSDVMLLPATTAPSAVGARGGRTLIGWMGFNAVVIAVWVATCIAAQEWLYFWPIWPVLITAIPVFLTLGRSSDGQRDEDRQRRRDDREERRQGRRDDREERHQGRRDDRAERHQGRRNARHGARASRPGEGVAVPTNDTQALEPPQPPLEYPLYRPDDLR